MRQRIFPEFVYISVTEPYGNTPPRPVAHLEQERESNGNGRNSPPRKKYVPEEKIFNLEDEVKSLRKELNVQRGIRKL